jgi:hypothetical protein
MLKETPAVGWTSTRSSDHLMYYSFKGEYRDIILPWGFLSWYASNMSIDVGGLLDHWKNNDGVIEKLLLLYNLDKMHDSHKS